MRRRSKTGGKAVKAQRRKTLTRRNAPKAGRDRRSLAAGKETNIARLTRERDEALKQQTATADVLKVISRSTFNLQVVLDTLVESAAMLCQADKARILRPTGKDARYYVQARTREPSTPEYDEHIRTLSFAPGRGGVVSRVLLEGKSVHIPDVLADPEYTLRETARLAGYRTSLGVPLLREGAPIGLLVLQRATVRPYTDKEIELAETFADQAVIAIENARLLNEIREALQQQTATSEVLKVISSSPGELEPVFNTMLASATRICEAKIGVLYLRDGDGLRAVAATHDAPPAYVEARKQAGWGINLPADGPVRRAAATKQVVHITDIRELQSYRDGHPVIVAAAELGKFRTALGVPMLKDDELIGVITINRQEVRPFTDKQIALVQNFAAQAVIAIENTRLLNELRQSLEQQTATADVLKVISSSPGDLEPVFQSMLVKAVQICEAKFGVLFRCYQDSEFHAAAWVDVTPEYEKSLRERQSFRPDADAPLGRLLLTKELVHTADELAEKSGSPAAKYGGARSLIAVPMRKHNELVGALVIYRTEVRPFTDKQIELVRNFAAQAVIAIENARLLNELRQRTRDLSEALEQQTATSEVLKVISGSPSELEPVFNAMLANATRICEAKFGNLYLRDEDGIRLAASHNGPPGLMSVRRGRRIKPGSDTALGEVIRTKHTAHVTDLAATRAYIERHSDTVEAVDVGGVRTVLAVPLLKDDEFVGLISIYRQEVRPFTDKQIELLTNFATQAVIAIENARLLNDLNKLNQQLEQRVTDQVSEIERMGKLRRFLPPQVADLIVASGTEKQLESHRREITALFCDLRGFTGFSESSDPEDVIALLREYHAAIGEIINKYGGTLERYAGDGVMVVFNDPIPIDKPAHQAVLMAIDMRAAIGELIEKWRKLGHDIGFGIGIAHGFATLGTIGFEGRFDYAAIGTVSNVASRLCDEAKPGQILISPRVLMAVEKDITVEPVGEFALKGIRRPLTAYNVLATKAAD